MLPFHPGHPIRGLSAPSCICVEGPRQTALSEEEAEGTAVFWQE